MNNTQNNVADSDRRIANRANVSWNFRGHSEKNLFSGVISNVSSSGCLARVSCKVVEEDVLTLRIMAQTDNGLKEINVTTVVKRVIIKDDRCFVGIQFRNLSPANKRFITTFVDNLLEREKELKLA